MGTRRCCQGKWQDEKDTDKFQHLSGGAALCNQRGSRGYTCGVGKITDNKESDERAECNGKTKENSETKGNSKTKEDSETKGNGKTAGNSGAGSRRTDHGGTVGLSLWG